jgi:hypothetical protein
MTIGEHEEKFAGLPVRDYAPGDGVNDAAGTAYRLSLDYDQTEEGRTTAALLSRFLEDPASRQVKALVFGPWDGIYDGGEGVEGVIGPLVEAAEKLPELRAIFLGDITYEECEISWINQSNVTPILEAYPDLQHFRVRGGNGLGLGPIEHSGLRSLIVEAGGLPASVVQSIASSTFPNLETLELWLGTSDYGAEATVDDLARILSGEGMPMLKRLGLRNAEIADQVAAALADAPLLRQIEELDLSLGTLSDDGAMALLKGGSLSGLRRLDIHHHFVSAEVIDGLKATGVELNDDERQSEEDYGRFVAHGE